MSPSHSIRMVIDGQLATPNVDALELQSARRALTLLRARLSPEQMTELLAEGLEGVDGMWREWAAQSDGNWQAAEVEFHVDGMSSAQFQAWWDTALEDVHGVAFPAFPEHYRFGWVADPQGGADDVFLIIEELGHVPFRMYCTFGSAWAPIDVSPGFEMMQPGVGRLQDGTEVVRFMNQIKDTDTGFAMKVAVFMVSAVPAEVVASHVDQEVVEWTRWLEMARASIGAV